MRVITSSNGQELSVSTRRSESADAQGINSLISPEALAVFGRVNVIRLLEKANLAVTLTSEEEEILAQASFFDHPVGDLVDQTQWEPFLQKHFRVDTCTPFNTLFLHLFVAKPEFAAASLKEIMRAVFNAVSELDHVCLVSPNVGPLALNELFEPLQCLTDPSPQCMALICSREKHYPKTHIRQARVEDHDDIMHKFAEQIKLLTGDQPFALAELIEAQDQINHMAVCEKDGVVVGFISVTTDVDMKKLSTNFHLSQFKSLVRGMKDDEAAAQTETQDSLQEEKLSTGEGKLTGKPNAFCIQFLIMDKNYETRPEDFIPYLFKHFPDLDLCLLTLLTVFPVAPLLQTFIRVPPRPTRLLPRELYLYHQDGLRSVQVRPAEPADRPAIHDLVEELGLGQTLLQDLDYYCETRRDQVGVSLQAFIAQVHSQVVGILIIGDELDVEFTRAHYNIESFIYFSHHGYQDHGRIHHAALQPALHHHGRHFLKEALRLARRSCLYLRVHSGSGSQEDSCVPRPSFILDLAVPVRPRRQIVYPLEELGINAPSRQITDYQAPFTLSLISRKLTMEPKVTVNARIVVVGASVTGLSFLEVLCFCPHLRFNNLTLVSTHGFPSDCEHEDTRFLSTSHSYSSSDLARLPLHYCVTVVTGKMVGIKRRAKYVLVSGGRKVCYDYLVLCTGQQYQVPRPTGVDLNLPVTTDQVPPPLARQRFTGPVPSNLFTLNDPQDCMAARGWLGANFVELEGNAIVYGNSLDVFTTVEMLLNLGVRGNRIHLVLTPPDCGGTSCFSDRAVDRAVASALENAQVHVHRCCLLAQMNHGEHPDPLTSVSFTTEGEPLHLQCGVFINLSNKGVDSDAFRSINGSFLPFINRLIINATFQTSDPAIYGAGPLTKFSGRYYADQWTHANFTSKEVGQDLAAVMLHLFDPTLEPLEEPQSDMGRLIPLYRQAKVQGGKLPGGFHYLHFTRPTASYQPDTAASEFDHSPVAQDQVLVTGRVETGNYFSLHLDVNDLLKTLTCLSLSPLPVSNYLSLYGKQQHLLGQLVTSYQQGLIQDLYSFFRQGWCFAVYHDRFSDLEQELQQIVSATVVEDEAGDGSSVDPEVRASLRSRAAEFLAYNRNLLPMYASQGPV